MNQAKRDAYSKKLIQYHKDKKNYDAGLIKSKPNFPFSLSTPRWEAENNVLTPQPALPEMIISSQPESGGTSTNWLALSGLVAAIIALIILTIMLVKSIKADRSLKRENERINNENAVRKERIKTQELTEEKAKIETKKIEVEELKQWRVDNEENINDLFKTANNEEILAFNNEIEGANHDDAVWKQSVLNLNHSVKSRQNTEKKLAEKEKADKELAEKIKNDKFGTYNDEFYTLPDYDN